MKLFLFGIIGIFICFFLIDKKEEKINKIVLENLNLRLTGVVMNVDEVKGFNGCGIITVHILTTNITEYDPRDTVEFYYCVIKDSIAEIYDHAFKNMIGDTINIDTQRKLQSWGSKWNESNAGSIGINPNSSYYDYLRKNTRFKLLKKPV